MTPPMGPPSRPRHPAVAALLLLLLALTTGLGACGAPHAVAPGEPHTVDAPGDWIAGTWDVIDARGAPVGSVLLRARRVTTATADGWYTGHWTLDPAAWPWQLHLRIDEGEEAGVRVVLGQPAERLLAIMPLSDDRLLVLQPDGLWTHWVREPAPPMPNATSPETP